MVCRLIEFSLVVLQLWIFKLYGIISISKINFFSFLGYESVKEVFVNNNNGLHRFCTKSMYNVNILYPPKFFSRSIQISFMITILPKEFLVKARAEKQLFEKKQQTKYMSIFIDDESFWEIVEPFLSDIFDP